MVRALRPRRNAVDLRLGTSGCRHLLQDESRRQLNATTDLRKSSKAGAPDLTAVAPARVLNAGAAGVPLDAPSPRHITGRVLRDTRRRRRRERRHMQAECPQGARVTRRVARIAARALGPRTQAKESPVTPEAGSDRSMSKTAAPAQAAWYATEAPTMPAPTTTTSVPGEPRTRDRIPDGNGNCPSRRSVYGTVLGPSSRAACPAPSAFGVVGFNGRSA